MPISVPKNSPSHPDYNIDLQQAIELQLMAVIDDAAQAGWSRTEIYNAALEVIENLKLAYAEDPDPAEDDFRR